MGRAGGGGGVGDEHHGKEEKAGAAACHKNKATQRQNGAGPLFHAFPLSLSRSLAEPGGPHLS